MEHCIGEGFNYRRKKLLKLGTDKKKLNVLVGIDSDSENLSECWRGNPRLSWRVDWFYIWMAPGKEVWETIFVLFYFNFNF